MKLIVATALVFLASLGMIFLYVPIEQTQGIVQKIFYIHVACAFTMYIGFFIAFLAGILYLLEKKRHWDELTIAAAEVGFVFCTVVLATGPIWAKPIWGVWWDWEPRLTTTLLLWLLYSGCLVLRGYFGASDRGRIITAITAIVAFLDVPLIHFSIQLWRGIHPTVMGPGGGGASARMESTLGVSFLAAVLLFVTLLVLRFRLERTRDLLMDAKLRQMENR